MKLTPPMGYFGSKVRIAPAIVDLLPEHRGYVEPYCGSLSVLLAKRPTAFEVVNDLDRDLMTFWRVLRTRAEDLAHVCSLTPHSRAEYEEAWPIPDDLDDELERARRVWVKLSQGRSGLLRASGWRYHEAPGNRSSSMPRTIGAYVARIVDVASRLAEVSLECRPALDVIARYGRDPQSLLYVDPPYLGSLRTWGNTYRHELRADAEHRELAEALSACRSVVVLSGYGSPLYDELYAGWDRAELRAGTGQNTAAGYQERTEVLWSNRPLNQVAQLDLGEVSA